MIKFILLASILTFDSIPSVHAKLERGDSYETTIEAYKKSELWSMSEYALSDSVLDGNSKIQKTVSRYGTKNIQDHNLNTAWVVNNSSKNKYFEFKFSFDRYGYAGPFQFKGEFDLFNGYCKSLRIWKDNSRVKRLLVSINGVPLCHLELIDTWHQQDVDISKFFKNKLENKNMKAKLELKSGDKIRFKILEIYPGDKFQDIAISEFLSLGGSN